MATITSARAVATSQPDGSHDTTSTHPYTCNSCQVAFRNSELQKGHMRSDWHRYNLKRRVTSLPPITSEVFTEKVLQAQASSTAAASRAAYERTCTACEKTYFSENAYTNHVGSVKHRTQVARLRTTANGDTEASSVISSAMSQSQTTGFDSDDSEEDGVKKLVRGVRQTTLHPPRAPDAAPEKDNSENATSKLAGVSGPDKQQEFPLMKCLFCNYDSPTIPLNVNHMERIHGMFIPEREYLVNLEGLIQSLYERVYEFHECLYCQKLKPTVFGLQTHMRDKGHCKIPFGTEEEQLEIGDYYDFTSTYSDVEDDDEAGSVKAAGGAKLGARRTAEDKDEDMQDADGWETDSSASSLDSDDLTAVPMDQHTHQYEKLDKHPHHSSMDPRPHKSLDGFHSHAHKHNHAAFYSDHELHLPSGRAVGHRSLAKYYKQNLHSHPSPAERQQLAIENGTGSDSDEADKGRGGRERGRALVTRANGGLGMIGVTDEKKKEVRAVEKRARKIEARDQRRFQWGNNKQNNFQKHYRDPLLQ